MFLRSILDEQAFSEVAVSPLQRKNWLRGIPSGAVITSSPCQPYMHADFHGRAGARASEVNGKNAIF
jgi:hypothetical protein